LLLKYHLAVDTRDFADLRLAYAQHMYKAQGRTVDGAFVLTGGWQTDRERSYVALTRAQDRADIYVSREDLGEQRMDAGAIEHLGQAMTASHAQEPSVARAEETYSSHEIGLELDVQHDREHELGRGIE
jgi:acyl CoA:acetate/3-ketoacid CoA transferase alpha subunit